MISRLQSREFPRLWGYHFFYMVHRSESCCNNSKKNIKVPNIGEFKDVEVIEVLVSEGQTLKKNDPLITIESDKSSVEIPSNFEGKIKSLKLKVGEEEMF